MLKRAILTSVLALAAVGIGGTAAHADHTAPCDSFSGVSGVYLWATGVTGSEDCTAETVPADDPTAPPTTSHCSLFLVVVGSCD